jgi:hypothetical protein
MAANIRTERADLSHVAGNIRSVSTNASHVSRTNSITPVAQQTPFFYYYVT